jgi:hypothetical protein
MGLLLGALAGGAQAFNEIADDHIKQWNEKDMLSLREQMDMAKEKRIEEAQVRAGTRQEEAQIRSEDRGLLNKQKERKSAFEFETNQENVKRATDAELYGLRAKDDYKYSRGDDEAAYRGSIARATDIDHTDYAGRALDHKLKRKALEGGGVSAKISEVDEYQLKSWSKEVETLDEAISSGMLQDEALLKAQVRLKNVRDNINNTLAKYQEGGQTTGGGLQDPLGLRQAQDDSKERERLLKEIEATGATIESLDNTDTEGLKAVLNDARRSNINDQLSESKGLLSRPARGRARAKEAEERKLRADSTDAQGGGRKRDILRGASLAGAIARIKARDDWSDEQKRVAIARITGRE